LFLPSEFLPKTGTTGFFGHPSPVRVWLPGLLHHNHHKSHIKSTTSSQVQSLFLVTVPKLVNTTPCRRRSQIFLVVLAHSDSRYQACTTTPTTCPTSSPTPVPRSNHFSQFQYQNSSTLPPAGGARQIFWSS
jgi:hypothetical protein